MTRLAVVSPRVRQAVLRAGFDVAFFPTRLLMVGELSDLFLFFFNYYCFLFFPLWLFKVSCAQPNLVIEMHLK